MCREVKGLGKIGGEWQTVGRMEKKEGKEKRQLHEQERREL